MSIFRLLTFAFCLLVCEAIIAQSVAVDTIGDYDDKYIRENPDIDFDEMEEEIVIPDYINVQSNHIIMNGANWSGVKRALSGIDSTSVSIIHIGDSHLQADIATRLIREHLQLDFGNAGRGLIAPLKMCGTNEPTDYVFNSKNTWKYTKLMKAPWSFTMGFTGTSVSPAKSRNELTIATSTKEDYNPFSSLTIFHKGKMNISRIENEEGDTVMFSTIPSREYTHIYLGEPSTYVTLHFESAGDLTVFGANLSGDRPGIFYHTIGNNGATYGVYNKIGNIGAGIAPLHPELVIISLGTNESFGSFDNLALYRNIDMLVKDIKMANPNVQILLVTPMECQRREIKTVKRRNKNGKLYTVRQRSNTYTVNQNIRPVRDTILRYGRDNGIAVYDWYEIAGGEGSSVKWVSDELFGKDRVHHTSTGYRLHGKIMYDALIEALRKN